MGSEYNRKQIIGDGLEVFLDIENFKSVNVGMGDTIWKSIVGEYKGSLSYSSYYNFNYSDGGASSDGSPSSWMPTNTAGANTNAWQGITYGPEHSGPPTTWTATDATSNITWTDIIYGNGTYVAVAWTGTGDKIMYSTDAINWTATADGNSKSWVGVAYGNGKFVAISDSGSGNNQIMYSTDGITWSNTSVSGVDSNYWEDITYGGGKFVAISTNGTNRVMYSSDGISWTSATAAEANNWIDISYGNGYFVAVSTNGTNRIMYSTDAITWTSAASPEQNQWYAVTYGDGKWVAVSSDGTNQVMYTTDPTGSWTSAASASNSNFWKAIAYGNGYYVAVSTNADCQTMYSSDAINWTLVCESIEAAWISIVYGDNKFVALAQSGTKVVRYTSESLISKRFVAVSSDGSSRVQYTTELTNPGQLGIWTAASEASPISWRDVTYGNGKFVAVSDSGHGPDRVMYSTDGISWTSATAAEANTWKSVSYGISYGNTKFVAVASSGTNRVMYSTDGINWTAASAAEQNSWTAIAYGIVSGYLGVFVAVSEDGTNRVMASSNGGASWTAVSTPEQNTWQDVTYGNGKFVAVASSGTNRVMYSTDGLTWSNTNVNYKAYLYGGSVSNPSGVPDNQWWKITYGSGYFVAVSSDGDRRVMYSPDGISWVSTEAGYNDIEWKSLGYGDGRFVSFAHTGSEYRGMYNRELDKKKCFNFVPFSSSNIDVYNATSYYDNITVSLWFKVWNTSNASLLKKGSDFHLELDSSGAIQCTVNGTTFFSNASVYNINTWYNVTVIDSLNLRKIYLNGVDIIPAGQANSTSTVLRPYGGDSWRLAGTGGFNGSMTMLQIYKRMLSTDEIIKNYQAQKDSYNL